MLHKGVRTEQRCIGGPGAPLQMEVGWGELRLTAASRGMRVWGSMSPEGLRRQGVHHGCCRRCVKVLQVSEQQRGVPAALPAADAPPYVAGQVHENLRGPWALRQLHELHRVADVALDLRMERMGALSAGDG